MKINYVTGDLIDGTETVIAHGCNARGKYRSGVAGAIRDRLPFAFEAYILAFAEIGSTTRAAPVFELGRIIWAFNILDQQRPRIVANMITQQDYAREGSVPGTQYVSYDAIRTAMESLDTFVGQTQDKTVDLGQIGPIDKVGFPLIGSDRGGGKWPVIAEIIEAASTRFQPIVYTLDGHIPT